MHNLQIVPPKVGHGQGSDISSINFLDPKEPILKSAGNNLPHWFQADTLQFLTFRLADSLPQSKLEQLDEFMRCFSSGNTFLFDREFEAVMKRIQEWLDRGLGSCILKFDKVQSIVEEALNYYDGKEWDLYDYVIMPNHVHLLCIPNNPTEKILKKFRRYTTKLIRKVLQTREEIWQGEGFDRIIRSTNDYIEKVDYIKANPINWKA